MSDGSGNTAKGFRILIRELRVRAISIDALESLSEGDIYGQYISACARSLYWIDQYKSSILPQTRYCYIDAILLPIIWSLTHNFRTSKQEILMYANMMKSGDETLAHAGTIASGLYELRNGRADRAEGCFLAALHGGLEVPLTYAYFIKLYTENKGFDSKIEVFGASLNSLNRHGPRRSLN